MTELVELDLESAVMELLRGRFPVLQTPAGGQLRVATEVPTDLSTRVTSSTPFVRVSDIGGAGLGRTAMAAVIDVDVYGRSRGQARNLAADVQAFLESAPHSTLVGDTYVLVDAVVTSMRPHRVPWVDSDIRRYYASYHLSARR